MSFYLLSALVLLADIAWHSLQLIGGNMISEVIGYAVGLPLEAQVIQSIHFML